MRSGALHAFGRYHADLHADRRQRAAIGKLYPAGAGVPADSALETGALRLCDALRVQLCQRRAAFGAAQADRADPGRADNDGHDELPVDAERRAGGRYRRDGAAVQPKHGGDQRGGPRHGLCDAPLSAGLWRGREPAEHQERQRRHGIHRQPDAGALGRGQQAVCGHDHHRRGDAAGAGTRGA